MQKPVLESLEERAMWMRESGGVLWFPVLVSCGVLAINVWCRSMLQPVDGDAPPGRQPVLGALHTPQPVYAGSAAAVEGKPRAAKAARPKTLLRLERFALSDADTLTADILLPYGITWSRRKIRVQGYDAWETSTARRTVGEITADEIAKGARATDHAWVVLSGADAVYIEADEEPRFTYERLLGELWFDPPGDIDELVNYGDYMRQRGFARPTDPVLESEAKSKKK